MMPWIYRFKYRCPIPGNIKPDRRAAFVDLFTNYLDSKPKRPNTGNITTKRTGGEAARVARLVMGRYLMDFAIWPDHGRYALSPEQ
jgi:hypothetical protein